MNLLLPFFLVAGWPLHQVPEGTHLHIRLTTAVGTYASRAGAPVQATVIAPVVVDGETVVPDGSIVSGHVTNVKKVGLGIVHETATLGLAFDRITFPDGSKVSLPSRIAQVDNGRERIDRNGMIRASRSTSSLCYRFSGYIRAALQLEVESSVAVWFIKTLVVQLPEPEIYYRAGSELTLALTHALLLDGQEDSEQQTPRLALTERVNIESLIEDLPNRTFAPRSNRPSDIVNVLFLGSREELSSAFAAAGWSQAQRSNFKSSIRSIRAVAEDHGYPTAPMSSLLVNNVGPDMSWEKGLNDPSKRHHIRLWKQPELWHGRELWVGAATQDINFAFFRPGQTMTHMVDWNIDHERNKVADDLVFTGCVGQVDHVDRPEVPHAAFNGTGDPLSTDGRLTLVAMNGCETPRLFTETVDDAPLAAHGNRMQRFVRREILSMRNDLIRTNLYYRAYEGARFLIESAINRHRRISLGRSLAAAAQASDVPSNMSALRGVSSYRSAVQQAVQ